MLVGMDEQTLTDVTQRLRLAAGQGPIQIIPGGEVPEMAWKFTHSAPSADGGAVHTERLAMGAVDLDAERRTFCVHLRRSSTSTRETTEPGDQFAGALPADEVIAQQLVAAGRPAPDPEMRWAELATREMRHVAASALTPMGWTEVLPEEKSSGSFGKTAAGIFTVSMAAIGLLGAIAAIIWALFLR